MPATFETVQARCVDLFCSTALGELSGRYPDSESRPRPVNSMMCHLTATRKAASENEPTRYDDHAVAWVSDPAKRSPIAFLLMDHTSQDRPSAKRQPVNRMAEYNLPPFPSASGTTPPPTPRTTTAATPNPSDRFMAAVGEKTRAGMPSDRAVAAVVKEQPDLHREYLAAFNSNRRPAAPVASTPRSVGPGDAVARWNALVAAEVPNCRYPSEAVARAYTKHPAAHAAMIAEVNGRTSSN